jgi:hypothetical protein
MSAAEFERFTGQNTTSGQAIVFVDDGFSERAGVGLSPPTESGEYVNPAVPS